MVAWSNVLAFPILIGHLWNMAGHLVACFHDGPKPADSACGFFKSDIAWVHWSFWAWSQMLLILMESTPTIHLLLKFCRPWILSTNLLQILHLGWVTVFFPCSHWSSQATTSCGGCDKKDHAATSGREYNKYTSSWWCLLHPVHWKFSSWGTILYKASTNCSMAVTNWSQTESATHPHLDYWTVTPTHHA